MLLAPRHLRLWAGGLCAGLALLLGLSLPQPVQAATLEQELLRQAPQLVKKLRDRGYKNVGVLKFRVRKGNADPSDNVGTLNISLANRVELALILANDPNPSEQLGIIQEASAVASSLRGANHLTEAGKQVLFSANYPLAWGDQEVTPDAFILGSAQIAANLNEMRVVLGTIDRQSDKPAMLTAFTVPVESDLLSEMGESFLVRGFTTGGVVKLGSAKAIEDAAKVKAKQEAYPLEPRSGAPITLEIWYGRTKVPFTLKDGKAFIPEPPNGQKVAFKLRRTNPGKERYAVVLKVNGENTLFRERFKDIQCHKWIMEPDMTEIPITGFQLANGGAQEFRVVSTIEAQSSGIYYGSDVGSITMTVFAEQAGEAVVKDPPKEDADYQILTRGLLPGRKPRTLAALQDTLREEVRGGPLVRGIIGTGGTVTNVGTRKVPFRPDPSPLLSATITYMNSAGGGR